MGQRDDAASPSPGSRWSCGTATSRDVAGGIGCTRRRVRNEGLGAESRGGGDGRQHHARRRERARRNQEHQVQRHHREPQHQQVLGHGSTAGTRPTLDPERRTITVPDVDVAHATSVDDQAAAILANVRDDRTMPRLAREQAHEVQRRARCRQQERRSWWCQAITGHREWHSSKARD